MKMNPTDDEIVEMLHDALHPKASIMPILALVVSIIVVLVMGLGTAQAIIEKIVCSSYTYEEANRLYKQDPERYKRLDRDKDLEACDNNK